MDSSTPQLPAAPTAAQPVLSPIQPTQPQSGTQSGLDPKIVTLAQSIRQVESNNNFQAQGKSGEYGAYQFMPDTWAADSKTYLGQSVPIDQATPAQQNEVAYKSLAAAAAAHPDWNVGNFASWWNAGDPQAYLNNHVGTNAEGVSYDTPAYAEKVATTYQQLKAQNQTQVPQTPTPGTTPTAPPSIGGFLQNTVQSGANFAGNLVNAAIHPLQTVQGLGSIAAGGLQELGGQNNSNTANFDNLKTYFANRYGGVSNVEKTIYSDPVGFLADLSSVLGVGGGIAGVVGKGAELAGAADAADTVGAVSSSLNKAAELSNPLSPVIAGGKAILGGPGGVVSDFLTSQLTGLKPQDIENIVNHPADYTPEQLATVSRSSVAQEVGAALDSRDAQLSETGSGYEPIKQAGAVPQGFENVTNTPPANAIPVESNFLENQLRKVANVDVQDGNIIAKGVSDIRAPKDVKALQNLLDTWKPEFQKGYLTPEEFLNLRQDLASAAKYDREFSSSKPVESVTAAIRTNLNATYRGAIPGLEQLDTTYAAQRAELTTLRKGFIDGEGNLKDSALNKIANATNAGKENDLARLEKLVPGITQKLQTLKTIENINKATEGKSGQFPSSFLKAGGVLYGLSTGDIHKAAIALAATFLAAPETAVPILRTFGYYKPLVHDVVAYMAKSATVGAVASAVSSQSSPDSNSESSSDTQNQSQNQGSIASSPTDQSPTNIGNPTQSQSPQSVASLDSLATSKDFDLAAARKAGYSDSDIQAFLQSQK